MAILEIRKFGDPALRQKASNVDHVSDLHHRLIADMLETMRAAPGVGLAGPQVGVLDRIFVWEVGDEHGAVFNPVITHASPEQVEGEEGCLSLPGLYYPVMRAQVIRVEGLDERGESIEFEAEDFMARVCQHEIDHLNGVLFIDHLPDELRREALTFLREQALGLPTTLPPHSSPVDAGSDQF
jgi:peptide deformylase